MILGTILALLAFFPLWFALTLFTGNPGAAFLLLVALYLALALGLYARPKRHDDDTRRPDSDFLSPR